MKAYILFLIITSSNGGVITERFSTTNLENCENLLLQIKQMAKHTNVNGVCIR